MKSDKKLTLSCCMIAKNESQNIGRCVKSLLDVADEIVVVDTGSCDDTCEIASSLGAKVIHEKWKNDFSAARNTSLKNASGDWILFIDCDEELTPESKVNLKKAIQNKKYEAYSIFITNYVGDNRSLTFNSIRLFRNKECFRFKGKIHEQIVCSIIENSGVKSIGKAEIYFKHHGYDSFSNNIKAKIMHIKFIYRRRKRRFLLL